MAYDEWPDVKSSCPICTNAGCAIYRGYYSRFLFCTELEFVGRLAIRTGYCKTKKVRFTLLPSFVSYRRRVSVLTSFRLREAYSKNRSLSAAIDEISSDLGEEFYLPISSASLILKIHHPQPP